MFLLIFTDPPYRLRPGEVVQVRPREVGRTPNFGRAKLDERPTSACEPLASSSQAARELLATLEEVFGIPCRDEEKQESFRRENREKHLFFLFASHNNLMSLTRRVRQLFLPLAAES